MMGGHFETAPGIELWHPGHGDYVFTDVKVPYVLALSLVLLDFVAKKAQRSPYDLGVEAERLAGVMLRGEEWALIRSWILAADHAKQDGKGYGLLPECEM